MAKATARAEHSSAKLLDKLAQKKYRFSARTLYLTASDFNPKEQCIPASHKQPKCIENT